jgi:phenylpyruvate tautomerase PptA (4-oxalocrotonate tautomerase family)
MPTVIIEGPRLLLRRKRLLAAAITRLVAQAYDWPKENVVLVLHENRDQKVARGGRLLKDRRRSHKSA